MQAAQMQLEMQMQAKQAENQQSLEFERQKMELDLEKKAREITLTLGAKREEGATDIRVNAVNERRDAGAEMSQVVDAIQMLAQQVAMTNQMLSEAMRPPMPEDMGAMPMGGVMPQPEQGQPSF